MLTAKTLRDAILEIMTPGRWYSRLELGRLMGRPKAKLNPHDVDVLEGLVQDGIVERRENVVGLVKCRYEYRLRQ